MRRRWQKDYISKNGYSPETNRLVGSLSYVIFYSIIFYIAFKVWGIDVLDDVWFWVFNVISYPLVGWFLRKIKFWVY